MIAEIHLPDGVIALVDDAVSVAIGAATRRHGLTECITPQNIIGRINYAVVIVVRREQSEVCAYNCRDGRSRDRAECRRRAERGEYVAAITGNKRRRLTGGKLALAEYSRGVPSGVA